MLSLVVQAQAAGAASSIEAHDLSNELESAGLLSGTERTEETYRAPRVPANGGGAAERKSWRREAGAWCGSPMKRSLLRPFRVVGESGKEGAQSRGEEYGML